MILFQLALAAELTVPGDFATLDEAVASAPLGSVLVLQGSHLWTTSLTNTVLTLRGTPGVEVQLEATVAVSNSVLSLESLTLNEASGLLVADVTDLSLMDVELVGDPLQVNGGQFTATRVSQQGSLSALGGDPFMPDALVLDTVAVNVPLRATATSCDLRRWSQLCASGSGSLSCDSGSIVSSLFGPGGGFTLTGTVSVVGSTFVDLPLALDGVISVQNSLFVASPVSDVGGSAVYVDNLLSGVGGDLIALPVADPGFVSPFVCTLAGSEPALPPQAGFHASTDVDADGDDSAYWEDCDDNDEDAFPGGTEVPGDGVDSDCDGSELCFEDLDGDGFGASLVAGNLTCSELGLASDGGDCDDSLTTVFPGADELCDGLDNDCGGIRDEGLATLTVCRDRDGDRYGDPEDSQLVCLVPVGWVDDCADCDDADGEAYPGATEVPSDGIDQDCDGKDPQLEGGSDADGDGFCAGTETCSLAGVRPGDCDDTDAKTHPFADESRTCDKDRNCDGHVGIDVDGDGYLSCNACAFPPLNCDCNDATALANPGVVFDGCDGIDNDCDGLLDEDAPLLDADGDGFPRRGSCQTGPYDCDDTDPTKTEDCVVCDGPCPSDPRLIDDDGDGYCEGGETLPGFSVCELDPAYASVDLDCDDSNPYVNPGSVVPESVPDGIDNNCDGDIDEDVSPASDLDADSSNVIVDCDDFNAAINPNLPELCNGFDDNCDGIFLDGELDADGDGWLGCAETRYGVNLPADCDDRNPDVKPYGREICDDGIDNDCLNGDSTGDGNDADLDGITDCDGDCYDASAAIYPGAPEVCNLIDDDCDGLADEDFDQDADGAAPREDCILVPLLPHDCDETNALVREGLTERCDGLDNNCNGQIDEGTLNDDDLDGLTECDGDCNDDRPDVNPYAAEVCDLEDHDCDGGIFTEDGLEAFDNDRDDWRTCQNDCDDEDDRVNPAALDSCALPNADCSTVDYTGVFDGDGDGDSACTDCDDDDAAMATTFEEVCQDGIDNDCDPSTSDECPTTNTDDTGFTDTATTGGTGNPAPAPVSDLPPGWFCSSASAPTLGTPFGWLQRR